jgi:hypothetical protein
MLMPEPDFHPVMNPPETASAAQDGLIAFMLPDGRLCIISTKDRCVALYRVADDELFFVRTLAFPGAEDIKGRAKKASSSATATPPPAPPAKDCFGLDTRAIPRFSGAIRVSFRMENPSANSVPAPNAIRSKQAPNRVRMMVTETKYIAKAPPAEVMTFYMRKMKAAGWNIAQIESKATGEQQVNFARFPRHVEIKIKPSADYGAQYSEIQINAELLEEDFKAQDPDE